MKITMYLITHVETVLREVLQFSAPADGVISRYFKTHPKLGGRERGIIAETTYCVLRNKAVFSSFAESGAGPALRRLVLLGLAETQDLGDLPTISEEENAWLKRIKAIDRQSLSRNLQVNLPDWLWQRMQAESGEEAAFALAMSMNAAAPLDLRVNLLKANREQVMQTLAEQNIHATPTPFAQTGLRLLQKPALQHVNLFKDGSIEVQDEGSQLLAQLLGARRGEMIADFCAGAGGKTLALGALMRNTGRIYAFDVSEKRLGKLKPRLARSGMSNVHPSVIAHEKDAKLKRLAAKLDRVLVDAPCSGLGTLRRNPDMKWRLTETSIAELNEKQISILSAAARLLKKGGRLVYATCSILREENEAIAEQFLAQHPDFKLLPVSQVLAEQKVDLNTGDYLKLYPHQHFTDGFFAAVFERA